MFLDYLFLLIVTNNFISNDLHTFAAGPGLVRSVTSWPCVPVGHCS